VTTTRDFSISALLAASTGDARHHRSLGVANDSRQRGLRLGDRGEKEKEK
jgi:hypothetical protein